MPRAFEHPRVTLSVREPWPLIGTTAFGIIDRGTNVLQVRVTSICALCCIFCSVDAGPCSRKRWVDYIVDDLEWLKRWVADVVKFKGGDVEILLDGVGDPLEHPHITNVVKSMKEIDGVKSVALETHGVRLNEEIAFELAEAGLDRINLSIDTLDPVKAKYLAGRQDFDVKKVIEVIEKLVKETDVDVHLTPVLLPGINEEDVKEVILWGKEIGVGKRWPPFTVQKYVVHKRGRKVKGVKEMSWEEFWKWIEKTEKELGVRLKWSMEEWGMHQAPKIPEIYKKGERVKVEIIGRGLLKGEWLAVPLPRKDVVMTVVKVRGEVGRRVVVKVRENKDNIYLASP
ncbi:Fe-S osidoreductase [Ignicoccus pacificus DSM 13166]|uniref:Fe-S osidoreductase n=1 Tax=Ignicoccus pacificus DSM 13166 TaxID=940294 RepID=A0A977PKI9_9CREN|nr:Fe-S osidoreductase [Ignicoccus pacificus DSM 13166]